MVKKKKEDNKALAYLAIILFVGATMAYFLIPPPSDQLVIEVIEYDTVDLSITEDFDAESYYGEWYEIARLPQSYEEGCTCAKAIYEPTLSDVKVTNLCFEDGVWTSAQGVATPTTTPGQFRVSFFPFTGGDYRVLEVADDYSWAIVGSNPESLWILSRTPELSMRTLNQLLDDISFRGFDTEELIFNEDCV